MSNIYLKAALLGIVAGMRSMMAPAIVSRHFAGSSKDSLAQSPLQWMGSETAANVLTLAAAGELVGDKLPNTPNRTSPGALGGRTVIGGLCGAAVFLAEGESANSAPSVALGAAIGAGAAFASTFATFYLRRWVGQQTRLPDPAIAVVEDALALGLGSRVFADS